MALAGEDRTVAYREAAPPPALADRVACLWWTTPGTDVPAVGAATGPATVVADGPPSILPDGCVDLVWHGGVLAVAGADTRPRTAGPADGTTLGVRLRPGAAPTVGECAAALRDRHPSAEELWGAEGRRLAELVHQAADDRARLGLLVRAVARRAAVAPPTDPVVDAAAVLLDRAGTSVGAVAAELGVGERLLRRRFVAHVGYGPKTLQRVLRLQRFLALAIDTDDDLAGLAVRSGHADQAHLSRETRDLAGATPGALVAARRTSGTSKTDARPRGTMAS